MLNINGHAIYALCEPSSGEIRYIGYSKNVEYRYKEHLRCRGNDYKTRWTRKLHQDGLIPRIRILCFVQDAREAKRTEIALIASYRQSGARLTNSTSGGDGVVGPSDEVKAKISASLKGHRPSEETRKRLSAAHTGLKFPGRVLSAEHKSNISAGFRNMSLEAKEQLHMKLKKAQKGRKPASAETRAKIVAANTGRKVTDQARANMSAAHKGKKLSPESIAKRSATRIANKKPRTPEHSALMSRKMKEAWERNPEWRASQAAVAIKVHTGRKHTREHNEKIGTALRGRKLSDEARKNIKAGWIKRKGKSHPASASRLALLLREEK